MSPVIVQAIIGPCEASSTMRTDPCMAKKTQKAQSTRRGLPRLTAGQLGQGSVRERLYKEEGEW